MKKLINKWIVRFILKRLSHIDNEVSLKVLNHAILKEMVEHESSEIIITYSAEIDGEEYKIQMNCKMIIPAPEPETKGNLFAEKLWGYLVNREN